MITEQGINDGHESVHPRQQEDVALDGPALRGTTGNGGEPASNQLRKGPPPGVLEEIAGLYRRGLCLQAYEKTRPFGPLHTWTGCEAAIWAGRLAANLGGHRLGRVIHWRNFKRHRDRADAGAYFTHVLLERFGPLSAANFQRNKLRPVQPDTPKEAAVYILTLRATIAEAFRDFVSADRWLGQAEAIDADHAWIMVGRSQWFERQDRYEEALERARAALVENPVYRPGIQQTAHLLQVLDRDDEALALLREASERMENLAVTSQLAVLEMEHELFDEAERNFDRCRELAPLGGKDQLEWVDASRVKIACRRLELPRAVALARGIDQDYFRKLVNRLEEPEPSTGRVHLRVPFVRQHDLTCAPATLSALSRFWEMPAEHLELAEEICYDGTPSHSERHWAETHGYVAREFTVTLDAAKALLDRGVPFTLSTTEITSGHLQAVVGYDELRASLLLRDPFHYYTSEALCPQFLERYAATGPRGMAMVPVDRAELLDELDLPDAAFYDAYHALSRALHFHQRDDALAALRRLEAMDPAHRLTWTGHRALAGYDANTPALLESTERLLVLHPDSGHFQYTKLGCLSEIARRTERLEFLADLVKRPDADPLFWLSYATELRMDGRELRSALGWVLWALRYRPADPHALKTYADILWDLREFDSATEMYRLASCASPRHEGYARSYFLGSRHLRRTQEALQFLRDRFSMLGRQSPWPVITLVNALLMEDDLKPALEVLEEARLLRPDDGDLLLFASDIHARNGDREEAEALLARAEGRVRRTAWLRSAAALADYRCDRSRALEMWREVLALEPLAVDANRAVAGLIAETEDRARAIAFLEDVCTRFPGHCGLHGVWAEFTSSQPVADREPVLRRLIEINPSDAWAHRELALILRQLNRTDEALTLADAAIELEPGAPFGYCTRGDLLLARGRREEARRDLETAIRLSVDCGWAVDKLMATCQTAEERERALKFIHAELVRQVVFGEALFAYRAAARGVLEPADVLNRLREARRARPDLWEAWVQEAAQLRDMERLDDALKLAGEATEKFPLLPRVWLELAEVRRVRLEAAEAITALEKALAINPGYGEASRKLGELALQSGDFERAREAFERACRHAPLDALNHGCLADVLWRMERREEAVDRLRHALKLEPGYGWAWQALDGWAKELKRPELALGVARELVAGRPGESRSHLQLAELLLPGRDPEALTAAERAIELSPEVPECHDMMARALALFNRFDEAIASCRPARFDEQPPLLLMREAWIESLRGNLPEAIRRMNDAVAAQPANSGAWQLLADWNVELGRLDDAERAAEQLIRLSPHDPAPLAYAANISLRKEDRHNAIARFRRSFLLEPNYAYGGLSLFDLLVEDGDFEGAQEVLKTLLQHHNNDYTLARQVRLLCRQRRAKEALPIFESLCRMSTQNGWALFTAAGELIECGLGRRVDRIIKTELRGTEPNVFLGALWVERRFRARHTSPGWKMRQFVRRGRLGDEALVHYLDQAALYYQHYRQHQDAFKPAGLVFWVNRVLRRYRSRLLENDEIWGKAGYFLTTAGRYRKLAKLCDDWRQRKGAEAWMLYNLSTGLQLINRPDEARDVVRHALGLRHDHDLHQSLAIRDAFEHAMEENVEKCGELLDQVDSKNLQAGEKVVLQIARALREGVADPADPQGVRRLLEEAGSETRLYFQQPINRKYYWRAVNRLCGRPGFGGLKFWAWRNYFGRAGYAVAAGCAGMGLLCFGFVTGEPSAIGGGVLTTLFSAWLLKR